MRIDPLIVEDTSVLWRNRALMAEQIEADEQRRAERRARRRSRRGSVGR